MASRETSAWTRGVVVALLVMGLAVLGIRSLVGSVVEHARSQGESSEVVGNPPSDSPSPSPPPSPSPSPPPSPSPSPSPSPHPSADDPLHTPFAPGSGDPPRPPEYDPTVPPAHPGSLEPTVIRDVIREAVPELRFCFEWQLGQHPELGGRVTMEFTIDETGHVVEPSVAEDALGDETVSSCFAHVIGGLRFPLPEGGSVRVRYPFTLSGAPEARRPEGI